MTTLLGVELAGRAVLVVGGGPVALRRAAGLLSEGAVVHVVAPDVCSGLRRQVLRGTVRWSPRRVEQADLDGVWLVQVATDDPAVNARVCAWAQERRVWCVNAGQAAVGSARTPALTRQDGLVVGVLSDGPPDPRRVIRVRDRLARVLASSPTPLSLGRSRAS